ncbi:flagellar motor protein MotB [Roseisolibacter sp. H3M3-2]|uniref:flagellar motor protein MotB n=1 Tax=Roseisolibacter sp. H3M3-2 TaxID=3031323 RepID=UPI0023D9D9C8|nr:flagellar motor protein MotB [Roseisolibacter sp. H3M3-2]MDF1503747.1 flagellar motor protein MotB [Roseisolibacter sp. H3M3-2]
MSAQNGAAKKIVIVRKKKVAGGGHHGGSWKVAYADFVTAMMAFFMVMWILGMDEKVKQAIEGYFSNPVGYKKGASAGASPISSGSSPMKAADTQVKMIVRSAEQRRFGELATQLRRLLDENAQLKKLGAKVDVVVTKDGLRIELIESGSGEVFFPVGSSQMKPAAVIALQTIAPELRSLTNPVVLEGHTDAVRYGTTANYSNWELSAERANAARRVLEAGGLPPTRVTEVRGLADRQPRNPDQPTAAENRRISILLPYSRLPERDTTTVAPAGAN